MATQYEEIRLTPGTGITAKLLEAWGFLRDYEGVPTLKVKLTLLLDGTTAPKVLFVTQFQASQMQKDGLLGNAAGQDGTGAYTVTTGDLLLFQSVLKNGKKYLNVHPVGTASPPLTPVPPAAVPTLPRPVSAPPVRTPPAQEWTWAALEAVASRCLTVAAKQMKAELGKDADHKAIGSWAATLFIRANQLGMRPTDRASVPPAPTPEAERFSEVPSALAESGESDDLPW